MQNGSKRKSALPWLWLSAVIIVIDQLIKLSVVHKLVYQQPHPVLPFLSLTLVYNPGAAFSFLGSAGGWQIYLFASISVIIAIIFTVWLARIPRSFIWRGLGLGLIIGGALGNFIDRIRLTYVIDYVDFHIGTWHFATFNFADSVICIGAFFLVFSLIYVGGKNSNRQA